MAIQFKDGKILFVDGAIAMAPACCCDSICYPVKVYRTGGIHFTNGYSSLEVQAVDNCGNRVFDWRGHNGGACGGEVYSCGCDPILVGKLQKKSDCITVSCSTQSLIVCGGDLVNCVQFGGGGIWCDNPQGKCDDDE